MILCLSIFYHLLIDLFASFRCPAYSLATLHCFSHSRYISGTQIIKLGGRFIYFYFFRGRFWIFLGVPGSMLSCFSDFLLFCFSAFLLFVFPASLLFLLLCFSAFCFSCFFAFLLLCFPCFSAFVLLVLSTPTQFLYLFFSSVMCFCCSTSCSFASLLPVYCLFVFHFLLL